MDWKLRRGQIKHLLYEHCLNGRIDKQLLKEQFNDLNNAEPIKHGRWEMYGAITQGTIVIPIYRCSECKEDTNNWFWHYCPHCGARMDGGENG